MDSNPARPADGVFRIAVLGDFSGRHNRGVETPDWSARQGRLVDRDSLDKVLSGFEAGLQIALGSMTQTISIREMDDFHPDRLFRSLPVFAELRDLRKRLLDPDTFAEAAAEISDTDPSSTEPEGSPGDVNASRPDAIPATELLGAILDETEQQLPASSDQSLLGELIAEVVDPHILKAPDARQGELVEGVDKAIAQQMRRILHHPDFQRLESVWRSVARLVDEAETSTTLKVYLFDVTQIEFAGDLANAPDISRSAAYSCLADHTAMAEDGRPWSLVVADYQFDAQGADVGLLLQLSDLCQLAQTPFVAAAGSSLAGCASLADTPDPDDWPGLTETFSEAWDLLRQQPSTRYLALAIPRCLQRLPYGRKTDPIDGFELEEIDDSSSHEDYLWGRSSFLVAELVARAFAQNGWDYDFRNGGDVTGLPLYTFKRAGQPEMLPCGEVWLSQRAAEALIQKGLTGVFSVAHDNQVKLTSIRSLAIPPAPLARRC